LPYPYFYAKKQNQQASTKETLHMNLQERIFLPSAILSGLYKDVLIAEKRSDMPADSSSRVSVRTIILTHGEKLKTTDQQYIFLHNILKACKIEPAETALLTDVDTAVSGGSSSLNAKYSSPVVLLFGLTPSILSLPIHFPAFQVQSYQDCKYMWAPRLDEIAADKSLKVTLWQCLQKIFGL
jgi:hypothetical protein